MRAALHGTKEVVSPVAVSPLEETEVPDAAVYLTGLAVGGRLLVVRYPERIDDIPEDDEDLVEKTAGLIPKLGPGVLEGLEKYHPHLVARVLRKLR